MLRQPSTWPYTAHTLSLTLADRPPARERALPPILTLVHAHSRSGENLSYGSSSGGEDGKLCPSTSSRRLPFLVRNLATLPRFHPNTVLVRLARGMHSSSTAVAGYCVPFAVLVLYRTYRTIPRLGEETARKVRVYNVRC